MPVDDTVVFGRSRCEACGKALGPLELIPLVSFLVLRGRCRQCQVRIARFYPAVELAALGVTVWAASLDDGLRL